MIHVHTMAFKSTVFKEVFIVTYCTIIIALNYMYVYYTDYDVKIHVPKISSIQYYVTDPLCGTYVIDPWSCEYTYVINPLSCVCMISCFVSNRTGLSMLPSQTGLPESCFIAEEAVDWCIQNIQEVKDVISGIGLMQVRVIFYHMYKDLQK